MLARMLLLDCMGGPALDNPGSGRGVSGGAPIEGAGAEDGAAAAQQLRVRVTARLAPAPPRRRAPDAAPRPPRGRARALGKGFGRYNPETGIHGGHISNSGRVGGFRDCMTPAVRRRVEDKIAPYLRHFNFSLDHA